MKTHLPIIREDGKIHSHHTLKFVSKSDQWDIYYLDKDNNWIYFTTVPYRQNILNAEDWKYIEGSCE